MCESAVISSIDIEAIVKKHTKLARPDPEYHSLHCNNNVSNKRKKRSVTRHTTKEYNIKS